MVDFDYKAFADEARQRTIKDMTGGDYEEHLARVAYDAATREGMATAKLPDHAKRFLAYMCAYHRAYVNQGGVSLHSEAANDSIDEIMDLVPQEFLDLDFEIPDFGGCDGPWKCFHCNALFEDRDAAMRHFGESEDAVAACLVERAPKADSALVGELREDFDLAHALIQEAKGAADGPEGGLVTNHLDAAEGHLDTIEAHLAALSDRNVVLEEAAKVAWNDIDTAPKDGSRVILAKHGWTTDMGDLKQGSEEWKTRFFDDRAPKEHRCWWVARGYWKADRQKWTDGLDYLTDPTHWMRLPRNPQGRQP